MIINHLFYPLHISQQDLPKSGHVMAIGDFDGVHLGHRHVIGRAKAIASEANLPLSIMTFHPHPREVLGHSSYARYLAPIHDKMQLFSELGVDYTFVVSFDLAFAQVSPEHFVAHMLEHLHLHTVVVGFDFTFGHRGMGTVDTLRRLSDGKFDVEVVEPFHREGEKVSSTMIRDHLHHGRIDRAAEYLGRPYSIRGYIVHGDGRGRTIGFPTANMDLTAPYVIPRNGVYAVKVHVDGHTYQAVMNIGIKPTFTPEETKVSLEVHLLDYEGDLYGRTMKVEFIAFLRSEQPFESVELLVQQIHRDVDRARHLLSGR